MIKISSKKVLNKYPSNIVHLSDKFKNNTEIIKKIVGKNGLLLEYVPKNMKDNADVVQIAYTQNPNSIRFASKRLQQKLINIH